MPAKDIEEKRMATDITIELVKKYTLSPKDRVEKIIEAWKRIYEAIKES